MEMTEHFGGLLFYPGNVNRDRHRGGGLFGSDLLGGNFFLGFKGSFCGSFFFRFRGNSRFLDDIRMGLGWFMDYIRVRSRDA